jgi:HSP20 family protein
MEQRDVWHEMRKHVSDMAETVDTALRKIPPFSTFARPNYPPVNIYEAEDAFIVVAEVPGVPKENLGVSLKQGALSIQGKEDRSPIEGHVCVSRERGPAEFSRQIFLPQTVDLDADPVANLDKGILTVRLKKTPPQPGKTVSVQVK